MGPRKPLRHVVAAGAVAAFLVGCAAMTPPSDARSARCPQGMTLVDSPPPPGNAFCIDRWEASLVETTASGERSFSPFSSVEGHKVRAVTREGVMPQAYISRNEADAACKASHKRLCTEAEWVHACEGRNPSTYPYGEERKTGWCNDNGKAPLQTVYGTSGNTHSWGPMNDPRLNQVPGTLAKTGSHPHCKSSWGAYDMMGNLHEWVADADGTFLGGYYLDTTLNGDGCHYKTVAHDAVYHDYSTGFRCCASAR